MTDQNDNVKVIVRCRPLNETEKSSNCKVVVHVDETLGTITVSIPNGDKQIDIPKNFTFDTVFAPDCKQVDVYNVVARPIVECVLEGYNGTIFAYGQTGTGKTFTMEGVRSVPELRGIIPNSFAHVFGAIAKSEDDIKFLVRVSYLEIYNEEVRDLLGKDQTQQLEVKERPDVGVYVKDLSAFVVNNADDMDKIMTVGNKNRAVGATNMNAHSSRSHAIFTVTIECSDKGPDDKSRVRVGKLHLVDLAGSERQSKTGATGQRLKEATKINLSLSTLGNVISALVDGKSTHIPYRNSKLTRLLQDSLGGNSKTVMVANVGPADYNFDETISTLRYANRAKNIKNNARVNEDPKDALLRQYQKEIDDLRRQLEEGGAAGDVDGEGEGADDEDEDGRQQHVRGGVSREKMQKMREEIEKERKKLESQKDMEEEEKRKIQNDLETKQMELDGAMKEQAILKQRLQALEKKIIVGGENLLEKAEEQERMLEESALELEERKKKAEHLKKALEEKEAERLDIEEKYSSLQEEIIGKTKKLKKVWTLYVQAKEELKDQREEHQREMEGMLDNVRELTKELKLLVLICDHFIPQEYMELIEQNAMWSDELGEWQLKCIAYTGNNMKKDDNVHNFRDADDDDEIDLSHIYFTYTPEAEAARILSSKNKKIKNNKISSDSKRNREVIE
ncbi:hypothetical protein HELRODRAFT_103862 [Helobdella robusta]|uniref:Kinesin-like protein n=1 Tax=Helobdella robusta TaxID=6412 RepID=T1EDI0_HELRO|nr:hypothetical protein HELRODRAFT_103862 [Helobdella robusta]ESN92261.1 hypothetical protein HELRODRAFT_103862 [Helobdella robusta]